MIVDFDKIEEKKIPEFKGGEGHLLTHMFSNELGKIMRACLKPGCSIGMHTHDTSSEVIYILSGSGKCIYDGNIENVSAGQCHYCPKGHTHSLINDSDKPLEFLGIVPEQ